MLHCFGRRRGKGGRSRIREQHSDIGQATSKIFEINALQDSSDRRLQSTGTEYADLCLKKDAAAAEELIRVERVAALPA